MATVEQLFGDQSRFYRGNGEIGLLIKDSVLQDPALGGLDQSSLDDGTDDKNLTVTADQIAAAIVRILHVQTNSQEFQDDPNNRVISTSVFPGRQQLGIEDTQVYDTYDFSIQVRHPSSGGNLPDPDSV